MYLVYFVRLNEIVQIVGVFDNFGAAENAMYNQSLRGISCSFRIAKIEVNKEYGLGELM